ncbi:hypothetical protein HID58_002960 [Brassica napus]|uniref:Legumain prodomain domain-containing protein n=1 Tax=Brassica napus TaxID=3708 RepID=A0ABQ8EPB3_BRANA|nr:hypothetical protein HID58_002960 [Brassica napus]
MPQSRKTEHDTESSDDGAEGQRWAVLVAGSKEYENYRHQAEICHAYQILRKGGLKDENIIVFMFDDIALNPKNPKRGVIINRPGGEDVYQGVPKDYTGEAVNVENFLNVILGNKSGVTGGSGKVVKSVTASNAKDSSYGIYCGDTYPPSPPEYNGLCLGDEFSVSWLEDSELHDMRKETLKQQYQVVKRRTRSSHVCRFGSEELLKDYLVSYIGTNPENKNFSLASLTASQISNLSWSIHIQNAPVRSPERQEAQKNLLDEMNHRKQIDQNIIEILRVSLNQTNVLDLLTSTRTTGQSLVDDWDCFKTLVKSFKNQCGAKMEYGMKYAGALQIFAIWESM